MLGLVVSLLVVIGVIKLGHCLYHRYSTAWVDKRYGSDTDFRMGHPGRFSQQLRHDADVRINNKE